MRIILWLAAASGAAALGGAALAQSSVGSFAGGSAKGGWSRGGHGPGFGAHRPFRPGLGRGDDRRGRHHRRFDRDDRALFHGFGAGIAFPYEDVEPHGNGFFAGGGGEVRLSGGRPYYDYDRAYPYEWASAAAGDFDRAGEAAASRPPAPCRLENGVRVCRGGR